MSFNKYLIILLLFSFTGVNASIYKLDCKYFDGNKKIKSSTWYVHNDKKKVVLAKINDSNVKFLSNKWPSLHGYGASEDKTVFDLMEIKIYEHTYGLAAGADDNGKNILILLFNETGLLKNHNFIQIEKQTEIFLKQFLEKRKKNQNTKKIESAIATLDLKKLEILDKYNIQQICPPATKVKKDTKGFDLSSILEILK
tara:strand:- start:75 stop:668 length:594 start_codon:yes stop_codon:yes gene_type:complete